jgi:predicted nucleotidyltransferase
MSSISGIPADDLNDYLTESIIAEGGGTGLFYAVTGSHIYGFSDKNSDIDIRGIYLVEPDEYLKVSSPEEQISFMRVYREQEIDFKQYELLKFGRLLYKGNYNVIELVFNGIEIYNQIPNQLMQLREIILDELPLDLPTHYIGMAEEVYRKEVREAEEVEPESVLYVLRGVLASKYVIEENRIEANIIELGDYASIETRILEDLIEVKKDGGLVEGTLIEESLELINDLMRDVKSSNVDVDKESYKRKIDDWMLNIRSSDEPESLI